MARRTTSDKILRDKAFNTAKNPKYDECQKGLASTVYKCFDKKLLAVVLEMRICQIEELKMSYTNQLLEHSRKENTVIFYRQYLVR